MTMRITNEIMNTQTTATQCLKALVCTTRETVRLLLVDDAATGSATDTELKLVPPPPPMPTRDAVEGNGKMGAGGTTRPRNGGDIRAGIAVLAFIPSAPGEACCRFDAVSCSDVIHGTVATLAALVLALPPPSRFAMCQ